MPDEQAIELARKTLEMALLVSAPALIVVMAVSLVINIGQVLTSLQDVTVSTVPRLAVTAGVLVVLMPWMMRRLGQFTVQVFSDLQTHLR